MEPTDRSILYFSLIETAGRRLKFLRAQHSRAAYAPDRSHYARRIVRLEKAFTWLLRRAPSDVLEDLVEHSPQWKDRVFDAILWAMELQATVQ